MLHNSLTKQEILWSVMLDLIGQFARKIIDFWCGKAVAQQTYTPGRFEIWNRS